MEFWEFLLQKEGDRTWLPLEAAKVEILEGRYRVMAHSSHTNTQVEIRVSQMLCDETPPKRRLLKRASQTNQDGLMVVMPFTRLQPGDWELQCIYEDRAKNGCRHAVQLQVLSQEDETSGEWNLGWEDDREHAAANLSPGLKAPDVVSEREPDHKTQPQPPANGGGDFHKAADAISTAGATSLASETSDIAQTPTPKRDLEETPPIDGVTEALKLADQLSRQIVDSVFKEIEHAFAESGLNLSSEPASPPVADDVASVTISDCEIALSQSAFMAQQGCPLAITGQIVLAQTAAQTATISDLRLPASELRIHLRDPQNSEVLLEQTYPVQNTVLPADFTLDLALPSPLPTRLMLGEITLHFCQPMTAADAWASQSFTITAPIHELLEAIANAAEGKGGLDPVSFSLEAEQPLDKAPQTDEADSLIPNDCLLPAPKGLKSVFQPLSKQPLPPKLHQPDSDLTAARPLILPNFSTLSPPLETNPSQPINEATADQCLIQGPEEPIEEPWADELGIVEESALGEEDLPQELDELAASETEGAVFELNADLATAAIQSMGEETVNSAARVTSRSVDTDFRALNLQERFWSRLSALTTEGHQEAAEFRSSIEAAGVRMSSTGAAERDDADAEDAWIHSALDVGNAFNADQQLAEEIVVYEDPVEVEPMTSTADHTVSKPVEVISKHGEDDVEMIAPTPVLKIPAVELTAGEVISIDVSLPTLESRAYVKLWISDRQTRALLDEPRWLMDLQPNGKNELFTSLRLKVPLGCTAIRFTAIAVDMVTQQESYKAVVDRTVFPPDLPPLLLDEFEV